MPFHSDAFLDAYFQALNIYPRSVFCDSLRDLEFSFILFCTYICGHMCATERMWHQRAAFSNQFSYHEKMVSVCGMVSV